ncbi:MAG: TldD/PmbA family protein [Planctomycetes bacterium]|nr:TldD/PmbA family protein [Planctomycetota bacterium]
MLTPSEARRICDKVLRFAGRTTVEVLLSDRSKALTRFANNVIHQNVAQADVTVTVRALLGKSTCPSRVGRAETNKLDDASLRHAIETSIATARVQEADPDLLPLAGPQRYGAVESYVKATAALGPQGRADAVAEGVRLCASKRLKAAGIFANDSGSITLSNSNGLFAFQPLTFAQFSITAMATDSSGWAEQSSRDVAQIDPCRLAQTAVEKALSSRWPKPLSAGEYDVVLEPAAVADLLGFFSDSFNAQRVQERASFVTGKLGQRVLGPNITLTDDAYHPLSKGLPFDFEGVPRQRVVLVENGVVRNLVHDRKTARKARCQSTGHALPQPTTRGPVPMNLVLAPGDSSLNDMIRQTRRGVLVTHFHYTNFIDRMKLIITGMTRDGTFLIENGKAAAPIRNMRFTESLLKAFSNVALISRDAVFAGGFWGQGFVAPALKIRAFAFTSGTRF